MKERLSKIMKEYSISPSRLADRMGIQRSGISHIMSGRNKPGFDFLTSLIDLFPDIDANWLLTGKGDMLKTAKEPDKESIHSPQKHPVSNVLFTDEHFRTGCPGNSIKNTDTAKDTTADNDSQDKNLSSTIGSGSQEPPEIETVVILLNNGKFRSFTRDSEKS
jgi:transcriptional regulator with XRE-family HTH domain